VGCGIELHVSEGRVARVVGDRAHPANFGKLCEKGVTCALPLTAPDRLTRFQWRARREEAFTLASPDDVLARTGQKLRKILADHGPESVALYISGQLTTEAQYLANKLCKGFLGANQIDSNSRLCMSSAAAGYKLAFGSDAPPGCYADIEAANAFFAIGANMADCHPVLFQRVLARCATGAPLVVADPRRTATAEKASLHLALRAGSDLWLLNGLLRLLADRNALDQEFIRANTTGWEKIEANLGQFDPRRVAIETGVPEPDLRRATDVLAGSGGWVTFWTMGLNQSTRGTLNSAAVCNLHLATGCIGKPGMGPFSLTGQPNAMGGREMGYLGHGLPGQRAVTEAGDRAFCEKIWNLAPGAIRAEPGPDAVELFRRMQEGRIRAVWVICTNPAASMPNRNFVREALSRAELVIAQDAFHPTETTRLAHVLLPGALWAEAEGTFVNSERRVTLLQQAVPPPGDARPDWRLICNVAQELGFGAAFDFPDAASVFAEITRFENPLTGWNWQGLSHARLAGGAELWPCPRPDTPGTQRRYLAGHPQNAGSRDHARMKFATVDGRARFISCQPQTSAEPVDKEFPFILNTGRLLAHWHTLTKTRHVASSMRAQPAPFIEVHPEDAMKLNLAEGAPVEIVSRRGRAVFPCRITNRVRCGETFVPFHWNDEQGPNLTANALTTDATDPISFQPELKACAVRLAPIASSVPEADLEPVLAAAEAEGRAWGEAVAFSLEQQRFLTATFRAVRTSWP
jgi:anaerobic selenocysteine-containing dehydrogenase